MNFGGCGACVVLLSKYVPVLAKLRILRLEELQNLLKTTDANTGVRVKLVVGNTRMGYHKELGHYDKYIDLRYIPEMSMIGRDRGIEIGATVTISKLSSGAVGTKRAIRARKVEVFLTGKLLTIAALYEAIILVKVTVVPEDGTQNHPYRSSLAVDDVQFPTLLSSSKQVVQLNRGCHPVGEPIPKSGASLQASGEAVYVDDIPSPGNRLHGAFIYSTKPFARVKGIKFNSESLPDGVTALISYKDIPIGGQNIGLVFAFGPEPLFAEKLTQYAGEPLAFVVSVEEAIERSSIFEVPPVVYPEKVGDLSKGMAQADHKILSAEIKLGLQYHFYMENQTALAALDEDNCMVVYSSTQCSEYAHVAIVKCLGVPEHNVRVLTRRVGGDSVRARNLHAYDSLKLFYDVSVGEPLEYTLTSIWERLATSSSFNQRIEIIKEFNRYSVWKKRDMGDLRHLYLQLMKMEAYLEAVHLSANSYFVPDSASKQYLNYGAAVEVDLLTGQTTILRSDILYDCGQSINPAVDLGQIEGAFVQGIGFFMLEEYTTNSDGLSNAEGTWTYKIPTLDTIPKQFNVEILNSRHHQNRFSLQKLPVSRHYS
ncbi:hypothetical protein GH714_004282 [Hevea brasiliensis]|uniref:Aldehyde oxidase/xanthine dehydrogenase a/b hammerhead domain-containing protein n=1 Tax=Hevea brasiliensis TaxID=3981 RepID=A0A6A6LH24_HEVBR|nr:hypothetical protein GH714_004282 [Hevea brasiliensis]